MDTKLLTIFLEVARVGGFAAAARGLDQDPSSVSRAVAQLEEELGVRLFQRTTRRVSLTEAGARFAGRIEPLMEELQAAQEEARSELSQPCGRLSVSASVAFGQHRLSPLIPAFLNRYPEIELDLKFTDRNVDLIDERVDLAVRLTPSVEANVIASKLMTTRYRVCASPGYVDAQGAPSSPEALSDCRCVCFDLPGYRSRWMFRAPGGEPFETQIRPRLTITGALGVRDACLSGVGPALLADWLIEEDLASGRLLDLFPGFEVTAAGFDTAAWILYPSRRFLPRRTRVMIDFLRRKFAPGAGKS